MVGRGFESQAERFSAIPRDPIFWIRVEDGVTLWTLDTQTKINPLDYYS